MRWLIGAIASSSSSRPQARFLRPNGAPISATAGGGASAATRAVLAESKQAAPSNRLTASIQSQAVSDPAPPPPPDTVEDAMARMLKLDPLFALRYGAVKEEDLQNWGRILTSPVSAVAAFYSSPAGRCLLTDASPVFVMLTRPRALRCRCTVHICSAQATRASQSGCSRPHVAQGVVDPTP